MDVTRLRRMRRSASGPTLAALGLATPTLPENTAAGATVSAILGRTAGSTLSLIDDAGGRFALSGTSILTGATATNYEVGISHAITLRETLTGYGNSPRDTVLTIAVSNVFEQPSLAALTLSTSAASQGAATTINILGATAGSAIVADQLPAGLTLNSGPRTITGTPSAIGTTAITLTETLTDSANSPRASGVSVTVSSAQQVIMAILAGQSNIVGRNAQDGGDSDLTDVYQFGGDNAQGDYQTLASDITPLDHPDQLDRVGPGINLLAKLKAQYPAAKIVAVPTAVGSTGLATPSPVWASSATAGAGGVRFEFMVAQANAARTAILGAWPGASITPLIFFVQGEQDASQSVSGATYYAALASWIANARARITGASGATVVLGSMLPQKWIIGSPYYDAGYAAINAQHVYASLNLTGVKYSAGPDNRTANDNLHYQPQAVARQQGDWLGDTLSDAAGPTMTSAASYSNLTSTALSFALAASDSYGHATFHINGGADAAQFEISDPYLSPALRWTGNGAGPAAGAYVVGVRARDGAGNYGATQTISITVSSEVSPVSFFTAGERGMVWDLSDLANLKQNVDGTGAVTAAGDPVGWVKDLSPNANHWTAAANNTTRPTYQVDGDGKPYLSFDGSNDVLFAATPFITGASGRFSASFGVFAAAPAAAKSFLGSYSTSSTTPFLEVGRASASGGDLTLNMRNDSGNGGGTMPVLSGMLDNATKRIVTAQYNGSNSTVRMRNAAARPSGGGSGGYQSVTQGTLAQNFALTRASLGASGGATPGGFFAGRLYSGYVIAGFRTDAEVKNGENWAASRALTAALP